MLPPPAPAPTTARPAQSGAPAAHPDDAVRQTDEDAATSRLSAVALGYLSDPYASLVHRARFGAAPGRKAPLINVGTHHRTAALDAVVDSFLACAGEGEGAQIVSLGAGSDTRFWRLMAREQPPNIAKYVEIDFAQLTAAKAQRIARSPKLSSALRGSGEKPYTVSHGGAAMTSDNYALLPLDLRDVSALDRELAPLLDTGKPTLLVAECVFCYLPLSASQAVISWFGARFARAAAVLYEMCGLDDAFGTVMRRNLAARCLSIPGSVFATPQAQAERFTDAALGDGAFEHAGAIGLWDVRERVVSPQELARISKLEILDEIEELRLVLSHYCVAWASKGPGMEGVGLGPSQ